MDTTLAPDPVHEARLRLEAAARWLTYCDSHSISYPHSVSLEECCDAAQRLASEALTWLRMAEH